MRLEKQASPASGETMGSLQSSHERKCAVFYKSQGSWPKEQLNFSEDPTVFLATELASSLSE